MSVQPRPMTYDQAVAYLSSLKHKKWRGGMDRMEEFVRRADLQDAVAGVHPRFIHVTGTNGKGSVAAFTQSMLLHSGYKTGGYFSPYVYDLRERIQLDGLLIEKEIFADLVGKLAPIAETLEESEFEGVSEFEFKTALGFMAWRETNCDWVALEVGIGGVLDSTNVVTPACSTIVSVGLDHVDLLGSTHAEIALQKAGIIKEGKPVVMGTLPIEAEGIIANVCRKRNCELWRLGREISIIQMGDKWSVSVPGVMIDGLEPGLPGSYQVGNMALAMASMVASGAYRSEDGIRAGAVATQLPGRFEHRTLLGKQCIFDGAHNGESAQTIADAIRKEFPARPVTLLTAMLAGHDPDRFYRAFEGLASNVVVTQVEFYRRVPADELAGKIKTILPNVQAVENCEEALLAALKSMPSGGVLIVTGSFYLLGDLYPTILELTSSLQNEA